MRPIVSAGRVVGLDIARALALIGMMATHILPDLDLEGVTVSEQVAGGRASALFAVLAGVSIALMSGRSTPQRGRVRVATSLGLAARAVLIAVIGLALGMVHSSIAVILTYYGVLFLLALPFLGLGVRTLAVLSGIWLVVVPMVSHLLRPHLPPPTYGDPTFASLGDPWPLLSELAFTGTYPAAPWLAYVLAGMALGRTSLSDRRTAVGAALLGVALAVLSSLVSRVLVSAPGTWQTLADTFEGPGRQQTLALTLDMGLHGTTPTGSWWWLAVDSPHTATPFDLVHTIGTSLLVIGVALLAGRAAPRALAVVFGAGAMTLTLYSAHVMLRSPGWWDGDTLGTYLGQVAAVIAVGAGFRLARRRGPLEAVVAMVQSRVRRAAAGISRR